jgi:ankyrin repeat protein
VLDEDNEVIEDIAVDVVENLQHWRPDIEAREGFDDELLDLLFEAVRVGHVELVKFLIRQRRDIQEKVDPILLANYACRTPLQAHPQMVKLLLSAGFDAKSEFGSSSLCHAADGGEIETVRLLLSHGADVNSITRWPKLTALQCAACSGHPRIVKLLLSHGADANKVENPSGATALHFAMQQSHVGLFKFSFYRRMLRSTLGTQNSERLCLMKL